MRSSWKLPYTLRKLTWYNTKFEDYWHIYLKQIEKENLRKYVIPKILNNMPIYIYNGRHYIQIRIWSYNKGRKLGEFAITKVLGNKKAVKKKKK